MNLFERYLSLWVALCIVAGVALGHLLPGLFATIASAEIARVNLPVAALVWLMIIPMLLKIDFGALGQVREHWRGVGVTLFINWAVKPFSMALLGSLFIGHLFAPLLPSAQIPSYIAGLILLAAAPCTAMVFVWSNLCEGEPHYTLSQVALNDVIMVFAFAPLVGLLLGVASITVPWATLLISVVLYIVVPVIVAQAWRRALLASGPAALARTQHVLQPVSLVALLTTLVLLFGFQGEQIIAQPLVIVLLAVPILIQVYLNAGLAYLAEPAFRRGLVRRRAGGADRRQQLLRTRGRRRHQPVRPQLRRGAGHRGRRAGRGARDALGGLSGEGVARLVRGGRRDCRNGRQGSADMSVTIYHNPACGTSRNTLAMIRQSGEEPEVIEYLKNPPDRARLIELIKAMAIPVRALLREKGTPYAELGLADPKWSDDELIDFMLAHPILINRPIVVTPKGVQGCAGRRKRCSTCSTIPSARS